LAGSLSCCARSVECGEIFVDQAITIIVFAITAFGAGLGGAKARAPLAFLVACLGAFCALSYITATGACLSFFARALGATVDCAVTVIVFAIIADFCAGLGPGGTNQVAVGTSSVCPFLAFAFAALVLAGIACFGGIVVNFAVAVVVDSIAYFGLGGDFFEAGAPLLIGLANLGSTCAWSFVLCVGESCVAFSKLSGLACALFWCVACIICGRFR
jgi:hypothetical protein